MTFEIPQHPPFSKGRTRGFIYGVPSKFRLQIRGFDDTTFWHIICCSDDTELFENCAEKLSCIENAYKINNP
jgi:hypothetical protein